MDLFSGRRSIRKYTDEPVTEAQVETLLRAAVAAPSAKGAQHWRFVVIRDREVLNGIVAFAPNTVVLKTAPVGIVVCTDMTVDQAPGYWVQDLSAATQNILLAAHADGLGSLWMGVYPNEERVAKMRAHLGLPDHIIPLCAIAVGHPGEQKEPSDRFNPEFVHYDRW